jgi:hypothetical protein
MTLKKPAPGPDPGVETGFGKNHAQTKSERQTLIPSKWIRLL